MRIIDANHAIGSAAGAVWGVLARNGPVSLDWLCRATGLGKREANRGVGWLAREGKLSVEHRPRRREARIAGAAERLRQLLRSRRPVPVARVVRLTGLPEDLARQGLGWLARDGRIALRDKTSGHEAELGRAAGTVWRLVRERGIVGRSDVARITGLAEGVVDEAIGWLVREGKLVMEERHGGHSASAAAAAGSEAPAAGEPMPPGAALLMPPSPYLPWWPMQLVYPLGLEHDYSRPHDETSARQPERPATASVNGDGGVLTLEKQGGERELPIGEAAGAIWRAIHFLGRLSERELGRETGLTAGPLDRGIGWLAREDKLEIGLDAKAHEWFRLADRAADR